MLALDVHRYMPLACHVLIIEDEPLVAMHLSEVLREEGAKSFSFAATQEDALASAVANPPDLVTSDVKLLRGTGPLAVEAIHKKLGEIPVIFVTGTPAECEPCAPPGQVLCKPVDEKRLAAVFHELLSQ